MDIAGKHQVVVDITGIVNAALQTSRYVGLRVKSAILPSAVPTDIAPKYIGAKFYPGYVVDFNPGPPPALPVNQPAFDGFTLVAPLVNVPGIGVVNTRFQLGSANAEFFTLVAADVVVDQSVPTPDLSGLQLLNCAAFEPPTGGEVLNSASITYSTSSGVLTIPTLLFNGKPYSAQLAYITDTSPMSFQLTALDPITTTAAPANTVASLGGSITLEPSQDIIPLCHGWVLIGDTARNRLVERNVISGATGKVYPFGTKPNQLMLDDTNGIVYFNVHPESQRLYKLDLTTGVISNNRIAEFNRRYSTRDLALGENGTVFAILYDFAKVQPEDPLIPFTDTGLYLGLLDTNANLVRQSIALADPIRIEYDRVFKRVFLTTQSNLATFQYDTVSHALTFVEGTDISVGSGCTDFSISPDGKRLAYPCPAGNIEDDVSKPHVGIHDLDPVDYKNPDGEWYLGVAPVSSTFSPDGTLLIATDGSKIYFFDVVTHLPLQVYELGGESGEVVRKIRLSRDGKYLLVFMESELSATNSKLYWMPIPSSIVGTPLP
ncbi:MAG: hypothetical protein RLZZ385_887 [Pseudomonadota bacterium]